MSRRDPTVTCGDAICPIVPPVAGG